MKEGKLGSIHKSGEIICNTTSELYKLVCARAGLKNLHSGLCGLGNRRFYIKVVD